MSKTITKVYLYSSDEEENNYRGTDYTNNLQLGDENIDNLDDTLDTASITLVGLPFRKEFEPETKFIIEKWIDGGVQPYTTFHWCVDNDAVTQPILSDDSYFNHHISLIEASVIAQKRLVDNISMSYLLKDVSLDVTTTYDGTEKAPQSKLNAVPQPPYNFFDNENQVVVSMQATRQVGHHFEWVMPNWYTITIGGNTNVVPSWDYWEDFLKFQEVQQGQPTKQVELPLPMLKCSCGNYNSKTFSQNGFCSYDVVVTKKDYNGNTTMVTSFMVSPNTSFEQEQWTADRMNTNVSGFGWIESHSIVVPATKQTGIAGGVPFFFAPTFYSILSKVATPQTNDYDIQSRTRVLRFDVEPNYNYSIILKRHIFEESGVWESNYIGANFPISATATNKIGSGYTPYPYTISTTKYNFYALFYTEEFTNTGRTNDTYPMLNMTFNCVIQGEVEEFFLLESEVPSAYDLFRKSLLTTQRTEKDLNIVSATTNIDDVQQSFYVNDSDKATLTDTEIIESFYNQNNFWQTLMEVGKYIHARPKINFGSDDRLVVNWKYYGNTNQKTDYATRISIFNSKFVEEYISSCSSYINNMVQLGGSIVEYVSPKSTSDDFLVYNDVAEIIISKGILEIVDMEVICINNEGFTSIPVGTTRNLAGKGTNGESTNGYVFERSVYDLLPITATSTANKGLAIYYEIGTNIIKGLNYRLPTINTGSGDDDYAIKRIIGSVFGISASDWKDIKVNNFQFKIEYRAKDNLRSTQARPDLRKYLATSKHDILPLHEQINNQQDILVDSIKFGNNIYGKLIRTGNTTMSVVEWADNYTELKRSGELYTINDKLYYVSKVHNTYYENHIISNIEFCEDFNRLSQIIGIPSEPRFYEIETQNTIEREVSNTDYVMLGTLQNYTPPAYPKISAGGMQYLASLMLEENTKYPKYSFTIFKNDASKSYPQNIGGFKKTVCLPLSVYSIANVLTMEWDTKDNVSAGDKVVPRNAVINSGNAVNTSYNTLEPVRYVDPYGRVDMYDFAIVNDYAFTSNEIQALPESPVSEALLPLVNGILFSSTNDYADNYRGIGLLKDMREQISINYNIQMLTDSDRFVLSSYLWQKEKKDLYLCLLKDEVNKLSTETIPLTSFADPMNAQAVGVKIPIEYTLTANGYINIDILTSLQNYLEVINVGETTPITIDTLLRDVNAIAIYSDINIAKRGLTNARYFVFARNVGGLPATNEQDLQGNIPEHYKTENWKIVNISQELFTNRQ